ncbi:5-formyltetrahydrofolate cyclo-ligase [Vibrio lentus]|uniref:5-formyltetrahydrofolate cyclo-ligase n=1 Tax=Vibrio lentus TaxID=136468 RepID=UPI000976606F|nr:5-formyltetrahydrofolate cyclo-ligase [Vibrio lentus]OMO19791.1 5-formyltetrahydrofolate cyclo-ligase [Vibrio lentus]PMG97328.1 5-formyltetrahydrofolate cyclo-ligase [Vibrio lentus]PMH99127.1 5-formyltetrahydrofolate cyclo-ligase [Vibrio lentus]PMI93540.1 5-formyltetrahydrofolate cyclo-ligase [Vibrio lentus]PMN08788.1 5-formyltetrahydrofolate cyclo-ligase [Vibrio lentus]
MKTLTRSEFRKQIRIKRNALSGEQQTQSGLDLVQQCAQLDEVQSAQHIALYISIDGELDTQPLIEWLWAQGKQTYLPVLHPFSAGHLLFLHYSPDTPTVLNKYGIVEPQLNQLLVKPCQQLDLILTPLVGFDSQGHRLGMGGGYYDRTLARWFETGNGATPIGLAHDCQHVDRLPIEDWDIPLPKIVTPSKTWQWENNH